LHHRHIGIDIALQADTQSRSAMKIKESVKRYGTRKLTRRLSRSLPWIGGVIAIATIGAAIKRKGMIGGLLHTALDAIPYLGAAKNIVEAGRGRDFIRDRADRVTTAPSRTHS
jgi:hypothetical protein